MVRPVDKPTSFLENIFLGKPSAKTSSLREAIPGQRYVIGEESTTAWESVRFASRKEKNETLKEIATKLAIKESEIGFLKKCADRELFILQKALEGGKFAKKTFQDFFDANKKECIFYSLKLTTQILELLPADASKEEIASLFVEITSCTDKGFADLEKQVQQFQEARKIEVSERLNLTPEQKSEHGSLVAPPEVEEEGSPRTILHMLLTIYDQTYLYNSQIIHTALESMFTPFATVDRRQHMAAERTTDSFSLIQEHHQPTKLLENSVEQLGEVPTVDIFLTQPRTLNTVHLQVTLPPSMFSPTMTITEARKALGELASGVRSRPERITDKRVKTWAHEAEVKLTEALCLFGPSGEVIKMPDISTPKKAAHEAMLQNSYRLTRGEISLLPLECRESAFQASMTIESEAVKKLSEEFPSRRVWGVYKEKMPVIASANDNSFTTAEVECCISYKEVDHGLAEIKTVIENPETGKKIERTTYRVREDSTREKVMKEYYDSGFLERDLLLAKAEFMKRYTEIK